MNLHDLVLEADFVITGTVTKTALEERPDGNRWLKVELSKIEYLKGESGSTLSLTLWKGKRVGTNVSAVLDVPTLYERQSVLLFLRSPLSYKYMTPIIGFHLGMFVEQDAPGGSFWVNNNGTPVVDVENAMPSLGVTTRGVPGDPRHPVRDTLGGTEVSPPMARDAFLESVRHVIAAPDPSLRLFTPRRPR